ncbi:Bug family tripartite tricarboxylate transporter substrate binding protein [Geodermatophilus poikilotrophus]|uniref:Tripartite-type tricarboxylate transporter, receptor component TctC n=1 Tax=Geodermatophilus poikilotrophus TaxID=1333667 RepID=A0A1I0AUW4_9ACTN|nr:tripartite tricarboxylate transporter substrate binding protein [Geodermatophilus poikilotrophus]SES98175.1 Tripartite-type tricarboxylate transporter, receptor component TctC [Geodermatophilus poikilotrophus]
MRPPRALAALLVTTAALAGCAEDSASVAAADYPSEDVRLLVPYTAGGPTDIAARAVGAHLEGELGRPVVVENLPGASGATAYVEMISAEPDGHTLSMTALPTAVLNYLSNDVGYTREDLAPVGVVTQVPSGIVVPADSPYQDVESLFEAARQDPQAITVGTPGATNTHAAETRRITQLYDIPLTVVPFEGNSEVQTALLGGNVAAGFANLSQDLLPAIEAGGLRVLAVGTEERLDYVDAPTLVEAGYPELVQSTTTFGVIAPAGTPEEVVATLEDALRSAGEDEAVVEALDPRYVPEEFLGSADLADLFAETEETFRGVVGD